MTPSELLKAAEYVRDNDGKDCVADGDPEFIEAAKKLAASVLHLLDDSLLFGKPIYDEYGDRITKSDLG